MRSAIQTRVAIIGSCVTRDVWHAPAVSPTERSPLFMLARSSLASLFAEPHATFAPPEEIPAGLSRFEVRMVAHDILKTGLASLVEHRPTHLILDFVDERFELLRQGDTVATLSWEAHLLGASGLEFASFERVRRGSPEALRLWRSGLQAFKRFLETQLPDVCVMVHDARCATEYLDSAGRRCAFPPDWEFWPGAPVSIRDQNELFARYVAEFRGAFPQATLVRAPTELALASERHRWGLAPYHYVDAYYRHVAGALARAGCQLGPTLG